MSELDFEAIADAAEAAVFAQHHKDLCGCDRWPDSCPHFPKERTLFSVNAYDVVVAAAPLIEKALREQIAAEIKAFAKEAAKTDSVDAVLGLLTGSIIASGKWKGSFDELADDLDELLGEVTP